MTIFHLPFHPAHRLARLCLALPCLFSVGALPAADLATAVVGSWKKVAHTVTMNGSTVDMHAALLQQRPCASKIRYNVNADSSYRLDASASDCDDQYKSIQQKLYAKTKWKVDGNRIMTSAVNFAVGQTYTVSVSGNRMTWIGTEGQGTMVFER